jgi:hypothetical protein
MSNRGINTRCVCCGRFMKPNIKGTSWVAVPDTPFTVEENDWQCKTCTDKYGKAIPKAMGIDLDYCTGIIK